MKKKLVVGFIVILLLSIGAYQFIKMNNDHLECEQVVEQKKEANGNLVTSTKHICKEKFSF